MNCNFSYIFDNDWKSVHHEVEMKIVVTTNEHRTRKG